MIRAAIAAALLGAVLGAGLAYGAVTPGAQTAPVAVGIDNFTFAPPELKVRAGTAVTWTNRDDIPHGIAWTDNAFDKSKALDTDDSYSLTFAKPGTYQYFCYIHPHMTGTIVVEAADGAGQ
jgi:amicyanin